MTTQLILDQLANISDEVKSLTHLMEVTSRTKEKYKKIEDELYDQIYSKRQEYYKLAEQLLVGPKENSK